MEEGEGLPLPSSPPSSPVHPLTGDNQGKENPSDEPLIICFSPVLDLTGENGGREYEQAAAALDEIQIACSSPVFTITGENEGGELHEPEIHSPPVPPFTGEEEVLNGGLTDELCAQIIRQVEYYFSDENLPTDKFMLKFIKKDKGFVPIGVIASFRKMKKLVKDDISLIIAALKTSTNLVVSSDGKKVKRSNPLNMISEMKDAKLRTVVVENLPDNYNDENIINKHFSEVGKILNITIHGPNSEEGSIYGKKAMMSTKIHALVEYSSVEEAEKAVTRLNDRNNWRNGIRVELLQKRKGFGKFENFAIKGQNGEAGDAKKDDMDRGGIVKDKKGQNKNRRKFHNQKDIKEQGSSSEITIKPLPGPRMPDGTRGFAMGRGRPINYIN